MQAYPAEARRRREQGKVSVTLDVDTAGHPSACTITLSSGSAALDAKTCELAMKNARLKPATYNGKPIPGTFQIRGVIWSLDHGLARSR